MTAKGNSNATKTNDLDDTDSSETSSGNQLSTKADPLTQNERFSNAQNQASLTFKEINNREEIYSRKRNLATFMYDDLKSTASQEDYDHGFDSDDSRGRKPGRRSVAEDEYDIDDDEDPKVKRKIQNRAAQRAFRERKERYVKELEKKIKYVQDSHVHSTTRLFEENQLLRSIVYTLELEINALRGTSFDFTFDTDGLCLMKKKFPEQSWLSNIGPPTPLPVINSFPPIPLAPLRIQPSHPVAYSNDNNNNTSTNAYKTAKTQSVIMLQEKKQKKESAPLPSNKAKKPMSFVTDKENEMKKQPKRNKTNPKLPKKLSKQKTNYSAESSKQQFTFAISTPATVSAHSNNDIARKNVQIEAVQLYPAHCMFDNNKQLDHMLPHSATTPTLSPRYTASVTSSSCSGNSCVGSPLMGEEEEAELKTLSSSSSVKDICEGTLRLNNENNDKERQESGLSDILKQFFDPTGNLNLSVFNKHDNNTPNDNWKIE